MDFTLVDQPRGKSITVSVPLEVVDVSEANRLTKMIVGLASPLVRGTLSQAPNDVIMNVDYLPTGATLYVPSRAYDNLNNGGKFDDIVLKCADMFRQHGAMAV